MAAKPSASWFAGAAWLVLVSSASAAWSDPPAHDGPTVVKGVVVTAKLKPTDAPPSLDAYATPAKFELVALSPDASQVAFVTSTQGMRLLSAYRFADRSRRIVKLLGGIPSAIAWADADHVLVTASRSSLRGTCDAGDERAIEIKAMATDRALQAAMDSATDSAAGAAATAPPVDAQATRSAIQSLQNSAASHGCVYYGVREQSAVTLVDLTNRSGRALGLRMGDNVNRPLGTPQLVTIGGQPALAGPFLELRTSTPDDEPVERVYLWRIDPKTGDGRTLDDGGGDLNRQRYYADDWLLTAQGEPAARSGYDFHTGVYSIQMRSRGAWKPVLQRPIAPKAHTFAPMLIGLGRDAGSVVILDRAKDEAADGAGDRIFHYYELAPDGRLSGPLEPDDAARDRPIFDPSTGRVVGFVQTGASERYVLSDAARQSLYQNALDAAPGQTVEVVSTADDPRKMIIHAQGAEDPGSYFIVDFSTGASQPLGEDYAQIPTAWVADQRRITYKAADGLEIEAILTLPPKPDPRGLPLVVLPHDGPQSHDKLGFDWLAQALASRGYLVLQPNYRGSDGYGAAFMEAGYGQLGRKMQSDLSDGVRDLAARGLADPKRVCIVGVGMGGYAALTAAATEAGTYRCAASLDGVSDPQAFAGWLKGQRSEADQDQITTLAADLRRPRTFEADPGSPQLLKRYLGAEGAAPVPVKLAASVGMPVLLVSEGHVRTAPAGQSRAMRDALQASGKDIQFVEVKSDADEALATKEARLETLTALLDFLAKHNPAP